MDRKTLEDKGLKKESIDFILNGWHKKDSENKEEVKTLNAKITSLNDEINTRNKDLEELKKVDSNEIQNKLDTLQKDYDDLKVDSEKQINQIKKDTQIKNALNKSNAKDFEDIIKFIDIDKISVDNGNLIGLSEQLENLKTNKSYLFNAQEEEEPKTVDLGKEHNEVMSDVDNELREAMGLEAK